MPKAAILLFWLAFILMMSGCTTPAAGSGEGLSDMQIKIQQESSGEARITAKLDESIIRDGSWVMFEIINPATKGPTWLQANYEGQGIYSTKTTLPSKSYTLLGHFYAAGGFHFSRQYNPESNSNLN